MDVRFIAFFALVTFFLSFYSYLLLGLLMLIKIFPKRNELLDKSQYVPMFDYKPEGEPVAKNPILYYLDLIAIAILTLPLAAASILLSIPINLTLYIISFLVIYSIIASIIILKSNLEDVDKFYINLSDYDSARREPLIFIRTADKKIERFFKVVSIASWSVVGFWILAAIAAIVFERFEKYVLSIALNVFRF